MKIYIIGAGGVGSWLAPSLCMLRSPEEVILFDGDTLETKNLNRQLFSLKDVGKNKAKALAARYGCGSEPRYYSHGCLELDRSDWLLVAVDNNPARSAALQSCDMFGCKAIVGANEVTSAEAYYYDPNWFGTPLDPRTYYEDILTDKRFDPLAVGIGCTGEAQKANRQLVTANFMAAALMGHLLVLWAIERKKFNRESIQYVPHHIRQNLSRYQTVTAIEHQTTKTTQ